VLCLARVAHAGFRLPEDLEPGDWIELPTLEPASTESDFIEE
jgi:hypothetical protein